MQIKWQRFFSDKRHCFRTRSVRERVENANGSKMANDRPIRIAVVDDDLAVLDSFRFVLELAGFQVATFPSAGAFLDSDLSRTRCLIIDHHMPLMTGLELAAQLRADGIGLPILLVTAAPSPAIVARAAELGIVRVLAKPPAESDLLTFVRAPA